MFHILGSRWVFECCRCASQCTGALHLTGPGVQADRHVHSALSLLTIYESAFEYSMTQEYSARSLSIEDLAMLCAEETEHFFRHAPSDSQYCFELYRRALADNDQGAWEQIYVRFGPLVAGWVRNHPGIDDAEGEIQEYVNLAFQRMWAATRDSEFGGFRDLASVLAYLKMCAHSVIVDDVRKSSRANLLREHDLPMEILQTDEGANQTPEQEYLETETSAAFWDAVRSRLRDEKEQVVVYGQFVLGLKPRAIASQYTDQFRDVSEVYRIRQIVLERLSRDLALEHILKA